MTHRQPTANHQQHDITMAAAAGNGPLALHMLSYIPRQCVRSSIGYDAPVKRICNSLGMSRYKSPKHSNGEARFMSSSPHHREPLRDLYRLIAGETHIRLTRASYPIDSMRCSGIYHNVCGARGPFPAVAAAMVGGVVCFLPGLDVVLNPMYVKDLKF